MIRALRLPPVPWERVVPAVVVVGAGTAAVFALLRPDLLMVERVAFVGLERASAPELRHLVDLPNGTAPWRVDTDRIETALEHHPWVRSAQVSVAWPDRVEVRVEERHATALLHDPEGLLFVDEEGVPFLRATSGGLDLPHLTGMGSELSSLHPELAPRAIHDALWLIATLDREGLVPRARVSEVSFSRTSGFVVHTATARLAFGPGDLPKQVDRLRVLTKQGLSLEEPRFVDLAPATVAIVRRLDRPTDPRENAGEPGSPPSPGLGQGG